jgi:hypothetical protein
VSGPDLYLASTPLIALIAAASACAQSNEAHCFLIEDFPNAASWVRILRSWRGGAFASVVLLPGRFTEVAQAHGGRWARERRKLDLRARSLLTISEFDAGALPARVLVGNDRRPETQYALHLASARNGAPCGVYLDDGLFTYLGDAHRRPLAGRLDAVFKRLHYGGWWRYVAQAGSSPWVVDRWLAYPELARDPTRRASLLPLAWFGARPLLRLCGALQREFGLDRMRLQHCNVLLTLPHSRAWRSQPDRLRALQSKIADLCRAGAAIALKYHPREIARDPFTLGEYARYEIPPALASELLLPALASDTIIAGESSTALLAARWLRPSLRVRDLGLDGGDFGRRAREFLAARGVQPMAADQIAMNK